MGNIFIRNTAILTSIASYPLFASKIGVLQDFCIPIENVESFTNNVFQEIDIFPLWLCPSPTTKKPQILSPHFLPTRSAFFVNVGIYGISPTPHSSSELVHHLEQWTKEAQGRKVLYSYPYYTPEDFWSIYPHKEYDRLRQAYHADLWMRLDQKVLAHSSRNASQL